MNLKMIPFTLLLSCSLLSANAAFASATHSDGGEFEQSAPDLDAQTNEIYIPERKEAVMYCAGPLGSLCDIWSDFWSLVHRLTSFERRIKPLYDKLNPYQKYDFDQLIKELLRKHKSLTDNLDYLQNCIVQVGQMVEQCYLRHQNQSSAEFRACMNAADNVLRACFTEVRR